MNLLQLLTPPPGPVAAAFVVGYSGGLDSTVLLHLAKAAGLSPLCAVHVHHGLQVQADDWASQAQFVCTALKVPLSIHRVRIAADDPRGPEAAARAARYATLAASLPQGGVLLTAHHQQDQAETLLLRLLRGTGVEGMAAMPGLSPFAMGQLWRPLLAVERSALRAYAEAHGLCWVEDPHNHDPRFLRAWLRSEVMPLLRARVPKADALLARAAAHAAEAAPILRAQATRDAQAAQQPDGSLHIPALLALGTSARSAAVRAWLAMQNLPLPGSELLLRLEPEVLSARADAQPLLAWPGGELRRYRHSLHAMPPLPALPPPGWSTDWDGLSILQLPAGCGELHALAGAGTHAPVQVRLPAGGERIKPAGHAHTRSLKALAQAAGLPPWLRSRMPMLYREGVLVSMAGVWASPDAPPVEWNHALMRR